MQVIKTHNAMQTWLLIQKQGLRLGVVELN